MEHSVIAGHYARKQILSKDRLISWSHRRRFRVALQLAGKIAPEQVLDYGCGDGTFLTMLMSGRSAPKRAIGAELNASVVEDCDTRLGHTPGLSFVPVNELELPEHRGSYDLVVCMEVLEHVLDIRPILDSFDRLLASKGSLLITVPVETGLPLVVKQMVRTIAGWRGIGDYPGTTSYTLKEWWAGIFAGRRQHLARPTHRAMDGSCFHDHKGFNWMALRESVAGWFDIERTVSSPLMWLPPQLASQVCLLARKRR